MNSSPLNGTTFTTLIDQVERVMPAASLVDELTYRNYRYNRQLSPHITVERWRNSFGPSTDTMETRYQSELVTERGDKSEKETGKRLHLVTVNCPNCDGSGRVCAGSWTAEANCICDKCGGRGSIRYTLRTEHVFPPIPDRSNDWSAHDPNTFDADYDYQAERYVSTSIVGRGATEHEAIADFIERVSEQD